MKAIDVIRYVGVAVVAGLLLTGCASSRKAKKEKANVATQTTGITAADKKSGNTNETKKATEKADFVTTVNANRTGSKTIAAKMNFKLEYGSKDVSVGGKFRAKRDDVIQLRLVFLGIKEVGFMELTQDSILVVDKMNNQYVKAPYTDIPYLQQAGIDFYSFQSLFWGELFVPNGKGNVPQPEDFTQKKEQKTVTLTHEDKTLILNFLTTLADGLITTTRVSSATNATASISTTYSDWTNMGSGKFPGKTELSLGSGSSNYKATIQLSSISESDDWETRINFNRKKYKQVSVQSIMKQIMSLAK